jgi:hypothetical protein
MDRKLHVDTLILIPTLKIYMFWYSRQTDRQTNEQTEKFIWGGLRNLWFLQVNSDALLCTSSIVCFSPLLFKLAPFLAH